MRRIRAAFHSLGRTRTRGEPGFILLEVLVSMTVFAVGILAVLTAVLSTLNLQKEAALRYRAGLILQEKLAETVLVPFNGTSMQGLSPDGRFTWTIDGQVWEEGPLLGIPAAETSSDQDESDPEAPQSQLFEIAVDVSWQTNNGVQNLKATQLVHVSASVEATP